MSVEPDEPDEDRRQEHEEKKSINDLGRSPQISATARTVSRYVANRVAAHSACCLCHCQILLGKIRSSITFSAAGDNLFYSTSLLQKP